jgi:UDP-glucose 4-epimerase
VADSPPLEMAPTPGTMRLRKWGRAGEYLYMRVLVTGVSGFLGRHVARALAEEGVEVTGFDLTSRPNEVYPTVVGDLLDAAAVEQAVRKQDAICHIGAIGDVYLAAREPALAASVNVTGSANVGTAAVRQGARVVYASTWEVYGHPVYEPVDESHPCNPDHPYNITKLAGERILLASDHLEGASVVALRLGTAYGSGLRPNSVFRLFIDKARRGEPIKVHGDGAQGRQFTHASDIARAFVQACRASVHGVALNTVAPETVSIKQLAEMVVERFPTELTFGDPRLGDVPPAMVSSQAILDTLSWKAEVAFADGLDELIESLSNETYE